MILPLITVFAVSQISVGEVSGESFISIKDAHCQTVKIRFFE